MPASILVAISGGGSNLQALVDQCQSGAIPASICAVVSNSPDAYGLTRARQAGIATEALDHRAYSSRDAYDRALMTVIDRYQPDLIVLAGFMRILTPEFVRHYHGRLINIHPSLLPKYRGLNTHQRALDNNDQLQGATVHFVTEELDGGPAIVQGALPILPADDAQSLAKRVLTDIEHQIYPLAVRWFAEGAVRLVAEGVELNGELLPSSGFKFEPEPT